MGIYIPNMEMPSRAQIIVIYEDGTVKKYLSASHISYGATKAFEVKPHGRLIDARVFRNSCYKHYSDFIDGKIDGKTALLNIEKEIIDAPTIIESEK